MLDSQICGKSEKISMIQIAMNYCTVLLTESCNALPYRSLLCQYQTKYEGYSESNLHLFLATNVEVGESSRM
jgi:hypothetical protein